MPSALLEKAVGLSFQGTHSWILQGPGEVMLVATLYSPPVPVMAMHAHCAPDVSNGRISCLVGTTINVTLAHR